ncbi:MAG: hypothetical protein NZ749_10750 [bacterium]|nr:hypothetical protein [bacterium]
MKTATRLEGEAPAEPSLCHAEPKAKHLVAAIDGDSSLTLRMTRRLEGEAPVEPSGLRGRDGARPSTCRYHRVRTV